MVVKSKAAGTAIPQAQETGQRKVNTNLAGTFPAPEQAQSRTITIKQLDFLNRIHRDPHAGAPQAIEADINHRIAIDLGQLALQAT